MLSILVIFLAACVSTVRLSQKEQENSDLLETKFDNLCKKPTMEAYHTFEKEYRSQLVMDSNSICFYLKNKDFKHFIKYSMRAIKHFIGIQASFDEYRKSGPISDKMRKSVDDPNGLGALEDMLLRAQESYAHYFKAIKTIGFDNIMHVINFDISMDAFKEIVRKYIHDIQYPCIIL